MSACTCRDLGVSKLTHPPAPCPETARPHGVSRLAVHVPQLVNDRLKRAANQMLTPPESGTRTLPATVRSPVTRNEPDCVPPCWLLSLSRVTSKSRLPWLPAGNV